MSTINPLIPKLVEQMVGDDPTLTAARAQSLLHRVRNGMSWLDETCPDWLDRIDMRGLDLASGSHCVLGQLARSLSVEHLESDYGDFCSLVGDDRLDKSPPSVATHIRCLLDLLHMPHRLPVEAAIDFGFDVGWGDNYTELDAAWSVSITNRKEQT